jgi:hypothetical protein
MSDMTEARVREILDACRGQTVPFPMYPQEISALCTLALSAIASRQPVVNAQELVRLATRCRRLAYPDHPPIFVEIADALDRILSALTKPEDSQ